MRLFKNIFSLVMIVFISSFTLEAQTSRLQVIHNSAEVTADPVDIYLWNDAKNEQVIKLDDFGFRAATPFVDVPANESLSVIIAGNSSSDYNDQVIATISVGVLNESESYVVFANGVLTPDQYAANPDSKSTAFELLVKPMARETSTSENVEFFVLHGATDAPTVDVLARDVTTLVDDAAYRDITDYVAVPAAEYILDVTPGANNNIKVRSYVADLSGLGGGSAAVFASGFLTPSSNKVGKAFGIFAALADGTVVEFPETSSRLQVIHNSAEVAADPVDIYLWNDAKNELVVKLNDFGFRSATPFVDVPADLDLSVKIAASTSMDEMDGIIATIPVGALNHNESYVVFANGVLAPGEYAANPDSKSTAFELLIKPMARETSTSENVEFFVLHGATDAPAVDVIARDVATLVDNTTYTDITDYIAVPAGKYSLDVTPAEDNNTIVGSFMADLNGLGGESAVVFASGFLTPSANKDGKAFGIFAALADGTVVEFMPPAANARLQVIHNSAEVAADPVDIYLWNDTKNEEVIKLDDFGFRAATPFVDVPSNDSLSVIIAGSTSADYMDQVIATIPVGALMPSTGYVVFANGVLAPGEYAANPEERSTAFELLIKPMARETSTSDNVEFFVLHGATDAPAVDVIARDVATLVDNAAYTDITEYIAVPAGKYTLDVTPAEDNNTIVGNFMADLSGLGGGSAVVFVSGFLTPSANKDGKAFGIFAALANGTVVEFTQTVTSIDDFESETIPTTFELDQNYPNPFNPSTKINFSVPKQEFVQLKIYNIIGSEVATLVSGVKEAGNYSIDFDATNLSSGVYIYRMQAGNFLEVKKMNLIK